MNIGAVWCPRPSRSARLLARALGVPRRRRDANVEGVIINWGDSNYTGLMYSRGRIYNPPYPVRRAISKQRSYTIWHEAGAPWALSYKDQAGANDIVQQDGHAGKWLKRRDGLSQGRGISVWQGEALEDNAFLVEYYPKTHEFRAHVVRGIPVDFTQKKWRGEGDRSGLVRSHRNGWIHAHNDLVVNEYDQCSMEDAAVEAVLLLDLDFGAVDIMARMDKGDPRRVRDFKICEVNTAPGLENTRTLAAYVRVFNNVG